MAHAFVKCYLLFEHSSGGAGGEGERNDDLVLSDGDIGQIGRLHAEISHIDGAGGCSYHRFMKKTLEEDVKILISMSDALHGRAARALWAASGEALALWMEWVG